MGHTQVLINTPEEDLVFFNLHVLRLWRIVFLFYSNKNVKCVSGYGNVWVCADRCSAVWGVRSVGVLMLKVRRSPGLEPAALLLTVSNTALVFLQ